VPRDLNLRIPLPGRSGRTVDLGADSWSDVLTGVHALGATECEIAMPLRLTLEDLAKLAAEAVAEAPPVPQQIGPEERTVAAVLANGAMPAGAGP
jgi:hypothetical protein